MSVLRVTLVLAAVLFAGCGDGDARDEPTTGPPPPAETAPENAGTTEADGSAAGGTLDFADVETVAGGLEVPWAVAFADEDTILVSERPGRIRVVERGELRDQPVAELAVAAGGEGGLLGLALHPEFPDERFAYVYYTADGGNRVARFRVGDDLAFTDEEVLLDGIPSAPFHNGGRIAFGPDGRLYVATGDAGNPEASADRQSLAGKILRLTPDGEIPGDNPFDGSPVYAYGIRNAQGLAWDGEGRLYASDHGPSGEFGLCCLDELNLVEEGGFHGWPHRAGTVEAAGGEGPAEPVEPIADSGGGDTWAPGGVAVHAPEGAPTAVLMTMLAGEQLRRFELADGEPRTVASAEAVIEGLGRLRAAAFGPDGCLYLTTSNRDGRGSPADNDDRVLRVCPA